jgi:hypothetical protein
VLNQALGLNLKRWPTDANFLYLYRYAGLPEKVNSVSASTKRRPA